MTDSEPHCTGKLLGFFAIVLVAFQPGIIGIGIGHGLIDKGIPFARVVIVGQIRDEASKNAPQGIAEVDWLRDVAQ